VYFPDLRSRFKLQPTADFLAGFFQQLLILRFVIRVINSAVQCTPERAELHGAEWHEQDKEI
jgi:hypothetical protein